jgi:hypothetical protein
MSFTLWDSHEYKTSDIRGEYESVESHGPVPLYFVVGLELKVIL